MPQGEGDAPLNDRASNPGSNFAQAIAKNVFTLRTLTCCVNRRCTTVLYAAMSASHLSRRQNPTGLLSVRRTVGTGLCDGRYTSSSPKSPCGEAGGHVSAAIRSWYQR
jgi:hypothetical protein